MDNETYFTDSNEKVFAISQSQWESMNHRCSDSPPVSDYNSADALSILRLDYYMKKYFGLSAISKNQFNNFQPDGKIWYFYSYDDEKLMVEFIMRYL